MVAPCSERVNPVCVCEKKLSTVYAVVVIVVKDPLAFIVRVGVLTLVSWLNSKSGSHTIMAI